MSTSRGVWRFGDLGLAAVAPAQRITLGEGSTPLIEAPRLAEAIGIARLYLKLESQNPTGSFKDRGTATAIAEAVSLGVRQLVEDSSGNAGASAAAYAARAGLRCTVYAPAAAPAAKLQQAQAYGARVVPVAGSRADVTRAARQAAKAKAVYHLDHNSNNAFVAGMQTLACELADELKTPAQLVMPVGGGSLLAGCFEGFARLGLPPARWPLFAVQPEACAPLVAALANGWDQPLPVEAKPTMAGGISIADPPRGARLLRVLRESGGSAVAVPEDAIGRWGRMLARLEGVYAEPTSAAAVAGLAKLIAERTIDAGEAAVVVITGSGLKDPEHAART
ncbi:MAG TPA: threonine synthase [Dehalococcoidia bacterium]|nr:threonine synthase [Dehalococcoidia bacterium]